MRSLGSTTAAGVGSALPVRTQLQEETRQGGACSRERRQRCLCATEEGLGRLEPSSPAGLTAPSLILHPDPPLTNILPPICPALLLPSLPAAPAISLFFPRLTSARIGNVAPNPNPRANQEETKRLQD